MSSEGERPGTGAASSTVSAWREFTPTAAALLYALFCTQYGIGFMALLFLPVLPIWLARMGRIAWRHPSRRTAQSVKLAILACACVAFVLIVRPHQRQARDAAQHVVDVISAFHASHGIYPQRLAQAGLDTGTLRRRWHLTYFAQGDDGTVIYGDGMMMFDTWGYDFKTPGWTYQPD